ncbi:hypothetical protein BB558_005778 [Smittium angustum]|uniref:Sister chromatid cohesion protein n=1 Tax=Smittium angustum TaxID=133377 RepID=A0A2U1IZJ0_SMIAN|nr:hypothetical protein BB558_005778 [Smittium angustum]
MVPENLSHPNSSTHVPSFNVSQVIQHIPFTFLTSANFLGLQESFEIDCSKEYPPRTDNSFSPISKNAQEKIKKILTETIKQKNSFYANVKLRKEPLFNEIDSPNLPKKLKFADDISLWFKSKLKVATDNEDEAKLSVDGRISEYLLFSSYTSTSNSNITSDIDTHQNENENSGTALNNIKDNSQNSEFDDSSQILSLEQSQWLKMDSFDSQIPQNDDVYVEIDNNKITNDITNYINNSHESSVINEPKIIIAKRKTSHHSEHSSDKDVNSDRPKKRSKTNDNVPPIDQNQIQDYDFLSQEKNYNDNTELLIEDLEEALFEIIDQKQQLINDRNNPSNEQRVKRRLYFLPAEWCQDGYALRVKVIIGIWDVISKINKNTFKSKIDEDLVKNFLKILECNITGSETKTMRRAFKDYFSVTVDSELPNSINEVNKKSGNNKLKKTKNESSDESVDTLNEKEEDLILLEKIDETLSVNILSMKSSIFVFMLLSENYLAKKGYLEKILDIAVKACSSIQSDTLLEMFENHPSQEIHEKRQELFVNNTKIRDKTQELVLLMKSAIYQLSILVSRNHLSEKSIITTSYIAIPQLLLSDSPKWVNKNTFESLFRECKNILCKIFENNQSQRLWILEEILTSLVRISRARKANSSSIDSANSGIQFSTMLILQLIQSSAIVNSESTEVISTSLEGETDLNFGLDSQETNEKPLDANDSREKFLYASYQSAKASSELVTNFLLRRIGRRDGKMSDIDNEYKQVLDSLVSECTNLFLNKNWPVAGLITLTLLKELKHIISDPKSEVYAKSISMDYLALIASQAVDFKQKLDDSGKHSLYMDVSVKSKFRQFKESFRTVIDTINGLDPNNLGAIYLHAAEWVNDRSNINEIESKLITEANVRDLAYSSFQLDNNNTENLQINTEEPKKNINEQTTSENDMVVQEKSKKPRYLNIVEKVKSAVGSMILELNELVLEATKKQKESFYETYYSIESTNTAINQNDGNIVSLYHNGKLKNFVDKIGDILNIFCSGLESDTITLRSKSLRALSLVVSKNPHVLTMDIVKDSINNRLQDNSALVRDAAIDLLGKYLSSNPDIIKKYFKTLCARVMDKGPAVRKRVMRILKEIYLMTDIKSYKAEIGLRILQRSNDEERTVKDLATKILRDLWLSEPTVESSIKSKPQPLPFFDEPNKDFLEGKLKEKVEFNVLNPINDQETNDPNQPGKSLTENDSNDIIVRKKLLHFEENTRFSELTPTLQVGLLESVNVLSLMFSLNQEVGFDLSELLKSFFELSLDRLTGDLTQNDLTSNTVMLKAMCSASFELFLSVQEMNTENDTRTKANKTEKLVDTTNILQLILVFSKINPKTVGSLASTLATNLYDLSTDSNINNQVLILQIYNNVMEYITGVGKMFVDKLEQEIIRLLQCSPQSILEVAVPCLIKVVSNKTKNYNRLSKLMSFCINQLIKNKDSFSKNTINDNYLKTSTRLLILAGLMTRHFEFDVHRNTKKKDFAELNNIIPSDSSVTSVITEILIFFVGKKQPVGLKTASVKIIGQLQQAFPELIMSNNARRIYKNIFNNDEIPLKYQLLRNFADIIKSEHNQIIANLSDAKKKTKKAAVSADELAGKAGYGENGTAASLAQSYFEEIIECILLSDFTDYHDVGFELLHMILDQGLVHPLKCIPALVAIESLPNTPLRRKASKLHLEVCARFDSFIHSLDVEGITLAYQLQLLTKPNEENDVVGFCYKSFYQGSELKLEAVLQPLYNTVTKNRNRRNHLLVSLVKLASDTIKEGVKTLESYSSDSDRNGDLLSDSTDEATESASDYSDNDTLEVYKNKKAKLEDGKFNERQRNSKKLNIQLQSKSGSEKNIDDIKKKLRNGMENLNKRKLAKIEEYFNETVLFVRYIAENLLTFQYSIVEEILVVCKEISKVVETLGMSLLKKFEKLGSTGHKSTRTPKKNETLIMNQQKQMEVVASIAVGSLVLVRETLKQVYKISEQKINNYSAKDTSPPKEKANIDLQLSVYGHWTLFKHNNDFRTFEEEWGSNAQKENMVPSWKIWPYATKLPRSENEMYQQKTLYCQLISDSTSSYN